jgi:hypothetical protein
LAFNARTGTLDPTRAINSKGVEDIRNMANLATDLQITQEYHYIPPLDDAKADANADTKSPRGTFAIQYDPHNGPGDTPQNAVQVFCENHEQLSAPFTFQTAAQ